MFDPECRLCGCTDDDCFDCYMKTGEPCHWVEEDLCSSCAAQMDDGPYQRRPSGLYVPRGMG